MTCSKTDATTITSSTLGNVVRGDILTGNTDEMLALGIATSGNPLVFPPDVFDTTTGMLLITDPDPSDDCFAGTTFDVDFPWRFAAMFLCP